jgi:iron complex outermembrane receptor protein
MLASSVLVQINQAHAQDGSEGSFQLEELVVTAQKRAESLQDAALPINAATGEQLDRAGIDSSALLNKVSPALSVSNGGGANAAFFVRGVGNFVNNGFTSPAIAFNYDGTYIGRPSSTNASFLDLNRVEVLKGPQGTLYGRNSTGGAINVIPNIPEIGENTTNISLGFGNYASYQATGVVNVSNSDNSAFRIAGTVVGNDGYLNDDTSDTDDVAVRVQYLNEVNDRLSVRVAADYSTQKANGSGVDIDGVYQFQPFNSSLPVPSWSFVEFPSADFVGLHTDDSLNFIADNATAAPLFSRIQGYAFPQRDDEFWGVNAEIKYSFENSDLVIIPSYRRSELNNIFNGPPFKAAINQDTADQTSIEARLSGSIGAVDYILGAYYFDESVEGLNSFNQFATTTYNDFNSDVESSALFARATWNLSDEARLVAGVRYTDESRSFQNAAFSVAGVCLIEPVAGPPSCPQVPTLPVALTIEDALGSINPSLLTGPPLGALLGQVGNPVNGVRIVTPYGPFGMFGPQAIIAITPTLNDEDGEDSETTFRLAVEYDLTPDNLLYASFESGFRAGGLNSTFGRESYEPEFIDAITLGSKNRFLDNRLEVNVELFHWDYEDQQLAALGLDARGNNAFYTRNVGNSTVKGAEVDFKFAASEATLITGNVQYLDNTYDDYSFNQVDLSDDTDPPNFLVPLTGCDYQQTGVDGNPNTPREFIIDCSGEQGLNSPEWSVSLGVEHTFSLQNHDVTAYFDARYRDERQLGFNYLPNGLAESVTTFDAALSITPNDNYDWNITAYVRNLTDEFIYSTYQLGAANVAGGAIEPPRTYGVKFSKSF